MNAIMVILLSGISTIFIFLAAVGLLRMPDFYLRLSVTVKATTFGIGLMLLAAAIFFGEMATTTKTLSIIFFLVLTAPVAAQMIGRTAYFIGVPLWEGSVLDELKNKYNAKTHALSSGEEDESGKREDNAEGQHGSRE